jgi:hypothetical protein
MGLDENCNATLLYHIAIENKTRHKIREMRDEKGYIVCLVWAVDGFAGGAFDSSGNVGTARAHRG